MPCLTDMQGVYIRFLEHLLISYFSHSFLTAKLAKIQNRKGWTKERRKEERFHLVFTFRKSEELF